MNLKLPSMDPVKLAEWWPKAEPVLARRSEEAFEALRNDREKYSQVTVCHMHGVAEQSQGLPR